MRIVLDASASIRVALDREKDRSAAKLLAEADEVLAPDLLVAEVVNTIWKYHEFHKLDLNKCQSAIEFALALVDTIVPATKLYREAFLLARTSRRPAYDMFYLALAQQEDADLLTLDAALKREAERLGIRVL